MCYTFAMKLWKIGAIALVLVGGVFFVRAVSMPPPGERMPDLGREHVSEEIVASTQYNSNPPTSGPHLASWVRPGVYTEPQKEGELIHSLEHGYIIISYNCTVLAGESAATTSAQTQSAVCTQLTAALEAVARKKELKKLVVVPRAGMESAIALTAWTYIDTFNTFDEARIGRFIDFHRDHGPEQTME